MATKSKGQEPKKPRTKKIDLATAKVADGALQAPTSVYEMVGYTPNEYRTRDFAVYSQKLQGMHISELQEHAYEVGALPNNNRIVMIKRLEDLFLKKSKQFVAPNTRITDVGAR